MTRCLVLSRYNMLGASSRVRFGQYFDVLAREGITCYLSPLLSARYLGARYRGSPSRFGYALVGYLKRLAALLNAREFDVVWVEGELFPGLPAWFEQLLVASGVPYVVDYDDAIFHRYDGWQESSWAPLYRGRFRRLLSASCGVTVGNAYLETLALDNGAPRATRIPSVVDLHRYVPTERKNESGAPVTVGWIGSPTTTRYLRLVEDALYHAAQSHPLVLQTVGAAQLDGYAVSLVQHPWSIETEIGLLDAMDIGIMPLPDEPWERGKCGYKLIQYMAMAKPVVASPVGVNTEIVSAGVNGFLASDETDWIRALQTFANSAEARMAMGQAGRARVAERYSVQAVAPVVASVLRQAAAR